MSNFGQAALTIVGTAVGAYFGYPQLGFVLGSLAGQAFFPTKLPGTSGPRLTDARTTTATVGAPVMEVIGTDAVAGNVMWLAPLREVASTEEVGGKGGPSQENTTYSYFQGIAIGICRGPMGGILRIWENGALVYDIRSQLDGESDDSYAARLDHAASYAEGFVFYPGDEDQMPDPTIEADKGEGMVPAFRGLCYIVFPNRQLQNEQGLRHPNFKIEVTKSFVSACDLEWSNEVLHDWIEGGLDPTNPLNVNKFFVYYTGNSPYRTDTADFPFFLATEFDTFEAALAADVALMGRPFSIIGYAMTPSSADWADAYMIAQIGGYTANQFNRGSAYVHLNTMPIDAAIARDVSGGGPGEIPQIDAAGGLAGLTVYMDHYFPQQGGTFKYTPTSATLPGYDANVARGDGSGYSFSTDAIIEVRRSPASPGEEWTRIDGQIFRVLQVYAVSGGPDGGPQKPLGPCLPLGDPNFADEAFWTAAYDAAVLAGDMAPGLEYGNSYIVGGGSGDYPHEQLFAYVRGGTPTFEFETDQIYEYNESAADPRDPRQIYSYQPEHDSVGGSGLYDNLADALAHLAKTDGGAPMTIGSGVLGHTPSLAGFPIYPYPVSGDPYGTPYPAEVDRIGNIQTREFEKHGLLFNQFNPGAVSEAVYNDAGSGPEHDAQIVSLAAIQALWVGFRSGGGTAPYYGDVFQPGYVPAADGWFIASGFDEHDAYASLFHCRSIIINRLLTPPTVEEDDPHPDVEWVYDGRLWRWLLIYNAGGGGVRSRPLGPARPAGHPEFDDEAFWTAAYDAEVTAGNVKPGLVYGTDYGVITTGGYGRVVCEGGSGTAGVVSLAQIITYLCGRCGISESEIDVSDLESVQVVGYTITRQMTGRDAIEPLRNVGFFDTVESGALLKFVARGKAPVRTIGVGDFAHESGQDPGPDVTTKDALESDLPRTIRIHYKAPSRDYEDGEQISPSRSTVKAVNDSDLEIAIAMSDDLAAKIAEVVWSDAWEGRRSHEFTLDAYHADLEASDVVSLPVDGYLYRVRLGAFDETIGILRKHEGFRDYDGNYVSLATADPPERRPGEIVILSPSEIIFLDLPSLRDEDNDAGVYATTIPTTPGATWRGASIYKSTDEGATFNAVAGTSNKPTVGKILTTIPNGDSHGFDTRYVLDVEVEFGSLESRSDSDLFTGANTIAVGAQDRWELLQFADVAQLSPSTFRLSRLIRGRKGTEWAMGTMQVNDRFVLVSGPGIIRLPIVNSEIGIDLLWKAITFGMQYNTGIDATYQSHAEALRPYSPIDVSTSTNESGDLVISWLRRNRLGHELTSGTEIPMSEAVESYEVDILAGSDVVRTLTSSPAKTVTYTVAQQVEDFGPDITAIDACVYQMSAVVGRGHPGCLSDAVDANEVEGSLEALPFIAAYDDRPCIIGTTSGGFIFARRGKKGEKVVVGFYFLASGASPPGDLNQFDDNYDGGGAEFFPSSYFASANVQNNFANGEEVPTHGFDRGQSEFSLYWRQNPGGGAGAQKWLISGDDDTTLKIVARAATPLSSTTRNVNALLPLGGGVIYALASEISIAPTNKPDVYKSTDGGATWTFIATTTGSIPAFEWLAPLRLFAHQGKVHVMSGFGDYVNAAGDLIDWVGTGMLAAMRASDGLAAIIDFDYTATEIVAIGFSASSWSSGGGYVGQTQRIIRSTDGGATWTVEREVAMTADTAPGFSYPIDWQLIKKFGTGYIVYGKALTAFAFPWALISTDAGDTWGTAQPVDTGDVTGNAVIQSALSDGDMILAVDTFGRRTFNGDMEHDEGGLATPLVYGRLSYSTDGVTFAALPGFPTE